MLVVLVRLTDPPRPLGAGVEVRPPVLPDRLEEELVLLREELPLLELLLLLPRLLDPPRPPLDLNILFAEFQGMFAVSWSL